MTDEQAGRFVSSGWHRNRGRTLWYLTYPPREAVAAMPMLLPFLWPETPQKPVSENPVSQDVATANWRSHAIRIGLKESKDTIVLNILAAHFERR